MNGGYLLLCLLKSSSSAEVVVEVARSLCRVREDLEEI